MIPEVKYDKTIFKLLARNVNRIFLYWNIGSDYTQKFIKKYGEKFLEDTKEILIIKNLTTGENIEIELIENTNNYYYKVGKGNYVYEANLIRKNKDENIDIDYGFKLVSNQIIIPHNDVLINEYNCKNIIFKNVKNGEKVIGTQENDEENINKLYNEILLPKWNDYKKFNGYV